MIKCPNCKKEISELEEICPFCNVRIENVNDDYIEEEYDKGKKNNVFFIIFIFIIGFALTIYMFKQKGTQLEDDFLKQQYSGFVVFIALLIGLASAFMGQFFIKMSNEKKKEEEKEIIIQDKMKKHNAFFSCNMKHINGLPLSENSNGILYLCDNQIIIEGTGEIFKLSKNKILDMNIKTSKEVQNSISDAAFGYLLMGTIGAALNASATEYHRFLFIVYKGKNDEEKCISLDIQKNKDVENIVNYIEEFKNNINDKKETEL